MSFLVDRLSLESNTKTPAGKNELVEKAKALMATWKFPLMVYEAERKLANLLTVPEAMVQQKLIFAKEEKKELSVNPDRVIETDLLRWIIVSGSSAENLLKMVEKNLTMEDFIDPPSKKMYASLLELREKGISFDLMNLIEYIDQDNTSLLDLIVKKKIQIDRAKIGLRESIQKILERNWMLKRESIKTKIQMGKHSENEILELAKQFDELKKLTPKLIEIEG
jgi:DNA primase